MVHHTVLANNETVVGLLLHAILAIVASLDHVRHLGVVIVTAIAGFTAIPSNAIIIAAAIQTTNIRHIIIIVVVHIGIRVGVAVIVMLLLLMVYRTAIGEFRSCRCSHRRIALYTVGSSVCHNTYGLFNFVILLWGRRIQAVAAVIIVVVVVAIVAAFCCRR